MRFAEVASSVVRRCACLKDAYVPMAVILIAAYGILAFYVLFGPAVGDDRSEPLLLLGSMALGPIAFLVHHHVLTTRQPTRGLATQGYIHTPQFQPTAAGLGIPKRPENAQRPASGVAEK